ncbi:hypothetical protein EV127DRAFT_443411 [Xylaria flabelliformis]|nr:hypothetical protein EV127DRAFT_443411 [Xylaria flabelliformis]
MGFSQLSKFDEEYIYIIMAWVSRIVVFVGSVSIILQWPKEHVCTILVAGPGGIFACISKNFYCR